MGAKHIVALWG